MMIPIHPPTKADEIESLTRLAKLDRERLWRRIDHVEKCYGNVLAKWNGTRAELAVAKRERDNAIASLKAMQARRGWFGRVMNWFREVRA